MNHISDTEKNAKCPIYQSKKDVHHLPKNAQIFISLWILQMLTEFHNIWHTVY